MLANAIKTALTLTFAGLLVIGCEVTTEPPAAAAPEAGALAARGATLDRGQPVLSFADLSQVGTSRLVRTPNGVNYNLRTSVLLPGHAYTLWIVIFNDPDGCEDGTPGFSFCGPMDVVNPAARPDMMFAAGHVAGGSGQATFAGRRGVGDASGSANAPVGLSAYGLEAPYGAEIHFVVHDHGARLAQYLPDMIQTIDGGCFDAGVPEAGVPSPWNDYAGPPGVGAFGRRGPNTCASVQFAVHRPN